MEMIVICDQNNAIGYENHLLGSFRDDMKHFISKTKGKAVIMGRNTLKSLAVPLKDRKNIVLTRGGENFAPYRSVSHGRTVFFTNLDNLHHELQGLTNGAIVIGGGQIYELMQSKIRILWRTEIQHSYEKADAYFNMDLSGFEMVEETLIDDLDRNDYPIKIQKWIKKD